MNERTFLQRFEESADRDRLANCVYDSMLRFCVEEGIVVDEVGYDTLEELADGFVVRGLGVSRSRETERQETKWRKD